MLFIAFSLLEKRKLNMNRRAVATGLAGLFVTAWSGEGKSRKKKRKKPAAVTVAAVDAILGPLALKMGHGTDLEGKTLDELEALMATGQRIIVLCGNQSSLAIRELARHGIRARLINPLHAGPFEGGYGHTSMEVRVNGRWQVFDMTANAQLVDANGRGPDVSAACRTRPLQLRQFADDPVWTATSNAPADTLEYFERMFQIPVIENGGWWRFHDAANRSRIEAIDHSWHWASKKEWKRLTR